MTIQLAEFPAEFQQCVRFHGHVCPGLAIGYAAVKAAKQFMNFGVSEDEEVVAVVENDSCAVDAVQTLLGCTFGKGNLIFRDWGKQVYTFIDRKTGRAIRVSFIGPVPGQPERHALRMKIDSGQATEADEARFEELGKNAVLALISDDPSTFFDVREVEVEMPPLAQIVDTIPCARCGEPTVGHRLSEHQGAMICRECASRVEP